jgi:short-subunit dehydrogenase
MSDFRQRYGPWALITGASSGIGREFARQTAARGLHVVLVARREERLAKLAAELAERHGTKTRIVAVDLCEDEFLEAIRTVTNDLAIGLLVNAAGFSRTGPFVDMDWTEMRRMLNLNCRAPAMLIREFGPAMRARKAGGIIIVASVTGFVATPQWSLYSASKAFNLLLGEGLAAELRGDGVDVLTLAPGTTRTEFLDNAGINDFMSLEADAVVRQGLNHLGRAGTVVPGWFYRGGIFATRFLPRPINRAVFGRLLAGMRVEKG